MKSIVRRDTGESRTGYLTRLAKAEGVNAEDTAASRRINRKRAKKMSNEVWENPNDSDADITHLKDGRTVLAFRRRMRWILGREPSWGRPRMAVLLPMRQPLGIFCLEGES
jgi:hypothetical protein